MVFLWFLTSNERNIEMIRLYIADASGNMFLVVRSETRWIERPPEKFFDTLRNQRNWLDSLIFLTKIAKRSYLLRIFEADGSESEMCANGSRAAAEILAKEGGGVVLSRTGPVPTKANGDGYASVALSVEPARGLAPSDFPKNMQFRVQGEPHVVVLADAIGKSLAETYGKIIVPRANLTLIRHGEREIEALTFERGVNRVTRSCGTGAIAAHCALASQNLPDQKQSRIRMTDHILECLTRPDGLVELHGSVSVREIQHLSDINQESATRKEHIHDTHHQW